MSKVSDKANKSYSNLLHYTNDYDFACLFVALIGDNLLYQPQTDNEDEKLYLYHNNQWKEDIKPHYLTRKMIFKELSKYTIRVAYASAICASYFFANALYKGLSA